MRLLISLPDLPAQTRIDELEERVKALSNGVKRSAVVSPSRVTSGSDGSAAVTGDGWGCSVCGTINQAKFVQCVKCGTYRDQ